MGAPTTYQPEGGDTANLLPAEDFLERQLALRGGRFPAVRGDFVRVRRVLRADGTGEVNVLGQPLYEAAPLGGTYSITVDTSQMDADPGAAGALVGRTQLAALMQECANRVREGEDVDAAQANTWYAFRDRLLARYAQLRDAGELDHAHRVERLRREFGVILDGAHPFHPDGAAPVV